jgi:hypothetical protein
MRAGIYLSLLLSVALNVSAQNHTNKTIEDSVSSYFHEIEIATKENIDLWDTNIYGPIILVDPITRTAFSNYPDSPGVLRPSGDIYKGKLPNEVVIANATTTWQDIHWAMIVLPFLSKTSKADRINLLAHELFHRSQAKLNFKLVEASNNHLDQMEGRTLLRLELEELKMALQSKRKSELKEHLANALTIRKVRYKVYPGAGVSENWTELNEGLAEYSGNMMSGRSSEETVVRLKQKIDELMATGTFVRTFAYRTIPVYGFLLIKHNRHWNRDISAETNLTSYFIKEFRVQIPSDLDSFIEVYKKQKFAEDIIKEEFEKDEKKKIRIALYKEKFVDQPHLEILFEKKRMSFDSRNLTPLENFGIVYTTLTASDNWGILKIENEGGLMSPNRDKISITLPLKVNGQEIIGKGWTLTLNSGYELVKSETDGNYHLVKTSNTN